MSVPEWVSKQLIETALKEFLNNKNVEVHKFESSRLVSTGDNFTSDIFRSFVTYKTDPQSTVNTISIIIKCSPETRLQMLALVKQIELFEKEAEVYQKILPALYEVIGDLWTLSPKFVYYTTKPYKIIMFEDLSPLGFEMSSRRDGLDLDHCLMIIDKMACLHAASVVLQDKNPALFERFSTGLYSSKSMIAGWMITSWNSVIKAVSSWPGYEKYSQKLEALSDSVVAKTEETAKQIAGGFNVLNHGDAWVNNFMFLYTPDNQLKDFRFVDFQMAVYASPAVDLHYFWATSPKMDVKMNHLQTVLDRYYNQLLSNLARFGYPLTKIPTRKQILNDFYSKSFYGLVTAATILPLVKAAGRQDATFEHLMDDSEGVEGFRHHAFTNNVYRTNLEYLLPFYDSLGAFV